MRDAIEIDGYETSPKSHFLNRNKSSISPQKEIKKFPLAEEEQRMKALHHTQGYQRRIAKAFHKKVKIRHVQQGDLVLKENRAPLHDPRGKFKRAYVVKEVLPGKAIKLTPRIHLNLILALNDPFG